jgi:hypothetical protein
MSFRPTHICRSSGFYPPIETMHRQLLGGNNMPANKSMNQEKMPRLVAAQVSDGGWAVVSSGRTALSESEAYRIIAAYSAVNELFKSTA